MTVTIDTTAASDSLDDQRTVSISPLVSPATVRAQHAPDEVAAATVRTGRADTINILNGDDDRLIVVVGPCSVHDPEAAMDYARRCGVAPRSSLRPGAPRKVTVRASARPSPRTVSRSP